MKINLLVALYRDAYFYHQYGAAVRDLQFLETLEALAIVDAITVVNRPVSLAEKALFRKPVKRTINRGKTSTIDLLSLDLLGPAKGRAWAAEVYPKVLDVALKERRRKDKINVFLDFLPIGHCSADALKGWCYWYDFIDNFKKHNRFSNIERKLVAEKYGFVGRHANYVTAVSEACMAANPCDKGARQDVITNKIFMPKGNGAKRTDVEEQYDLGFIGFITDKLDVDFIEKAQARYKIAIFGKSMDANVSKRLSALPNVKLHGPFSYGDIPGICSSFKVGIIPYRADKSHDGSPLKLYEYIKFNRPCITSIDYEIKDLDFIANYNSSSFDESAIERLIAMSGKEEISKSIQQDWLLENSLKQVTECIEANSEFCK